MIRPKVYLASKIRHSAYLKKIRETKPNLEITSRWLDMVHLEPTQGSLDRELGAWCWSIDVADVLRSDCLLVYAEQEDILCGALVEVGVALAKDIPVFLVGTSKSFGTWKSHPQVLAFNSINKAADVIEEWLRRPRLQLVH